jgi:hypothetical protein
MYFNNCKTIDEAKALFYELCKKLHPDTSGGDTQSDFIKMYSEFKAFKPSQQREGEQPHNAEQFYNTLKNFDILNNIKVSFVGSFIWLEDIEAGATFFQKEAIKSIKIDGMNPARFASQKKSWYFSPTDYQQKSRSKKDLETIKTVYGCNTFETKGKFQLS